MNLYTHIFCIYIILLQSKCGVSSENEVDIESLVVLYVLDKNFALSLVKSLRNWKHIVDLIPTRL